jgi:oligopeptide/dipeptide ABC transporter ATP-binding protein
MVFQDPYAAFDPIMPIGSSLEQPLIVQGDIPRQERRQKVADLFHLLGLSPEDGDRFPRSFSGGQLQRIAIGRAIITNPSLVVCDEPVASLDVSIRGQVLNLLLDLQRQHDVSFMFISHDLSVVRRFADRTVVMYAGQVLEERTTESLFRDPLHPYTRALLDAMPVADPLARRDEIPAAEKPSSSQPSLGVGCAYRHRCPFVMDECHSVTPELVMAHGSGSLVACHLYGPKRSEGSEAHEAHEAHERTVDVAHSGAAAVDEPGRQGE